MLDVLILNSGAWYLAEELPAEPWHVLIYRQRIEPRNELHVWLPRQGVRDAGEYAFRRYWVEGRTRWCVELPPDPDRMRIAHVARKDGRRLRFTAPDGMVIWSTAPAPKSLGDLTDRELQRLREGGRMGPFSRI